jgi:hypothetical protein
VLDKHRRLIVNGAVHRILILGNRDLPEDPLERVLEGFADFVIPFEKFEGHPARKARDGKWRIVSCLSLVDQLVERVLYSDFIDPVKEDYPNSGAVIGIGFTDELSRQFCETIPDGVYSTDISGMDRSLHASYVRACVERKIETLGPRFIKYKRVMRAHNECMLHPVFAVPTKNSRAQLFVGHEPKGMLSGRFVTTFFNSDIRVDMAYLAGASFVKACGDDCLEKHDCTDAELIAKYERLGFKLRDPELLTERLIKFCSHSFRRADDYKASLDSWPKALHKLASRPILQSHVAAFLYEVRHNPEYAELAGLLAKEGVLHLP